MSSEQLQAFIGAWLPRLEAELRAGVTCEASMLQAYYGMLQYHMGWVNEAFEAEQLPAGKRLRPMLCLLACAEVGGDPVAALPAAASLELLHNFSLIHDDVEDGDETRRHRATVWSLWGVPQAVNAGDGMFALAYRAMLGLARLGVDDKIVIDALASMTDTCIELTEGQYLDMNFEQRHDVTVEEYMRMIEGKTASLIGTSVAIGALIGGADARAVDALRNFGRSIGLTFQIRDDILGIWGDPETTGKAAGNDILRRKKSLPLLYALNHGRIGPQLQLYFAQEPTPNDLPAILALLEQAGARAYAEAELTRLHDQGMSALASVLGENADQLALHALAEGMLTRVR